VLPGPLDPRDHAYFDAMVDAALRLVQPQRRT
jgi:hypothetical protein